MSKEAQLPPKRRLLGLGFYSGAEVTELLSYSAKGRYLWTHEGPVGSFGTTEGAGLQCSPIPSSMFKLEIPSQSDPPNETIEDTCRLSALPVEIMELVLLHMDSTSKACLSLTSQGYNRFLR